jgi:hypothetical protein
MYLWRGFRISDNLKLKLLLKNQRNANSGFAKVAVWFPKESFVYI